MSFRQWKTTENFGSEAKIKKAAFLPISVIFLELKNHVIYTMKFWKQSEMVNFYICLYYPEFIFSGHSIKLLFFLKKKISRMFWKTTEKKFLFFIEIYIIYESEHFSSYLKVINHQDLSFDYCKSILQSFSTSSVFNVTARVTLLKYKAEGVTNQISKAL